MLTFLLICLSVLDLGLPSYGCIQSSDPDVWYVAQLVKERPLWYLIHVGMSEAEAVTILGQPTGRYPCGGNLSVATCHFRGGYIDFFDGKVERYGVSKLIVVHSSVSDAYSFGLSNIEHLVPRADLDKVTGKPDTLEASLKALVDSPCSTSNTMQAAIQEGSSFIMSAGTIYDHMGNVVGVFDNFDAPKEAIGLDLDENTFHALVTGSYEINILPRLLPPRKDVVDSESGWGSKVR